MQVPSRVYSQRLGKSISSSSLVAEALALLIVHTKVSFVVGCSGGWIFLCHKDGDQVRLKRPVPQGMLRVWALEASLEFCIGVAGA
eukprot:4700337-Amphidinium_carterae.1